MNSVLAKRLREARTRNGWTQEQVADWAGLKTSTELSHYESGRREPGAVRLKRLAEGLRVSADWLLGLEDSP